MEMHGNVRYMHCSDEDKECSLKFFKAPELHEVHDRTNHVPKCTSCGEPMKPHCMFFDECYSEHYYRDASIRELEYSIDALIVIGTALATGGAKSLVLRTLDKKEVPVIEINLDPIIDEGFALSLSEKCEVSLEKMFKEYHRLSDPKTAATKPAALGSSSRATASAPKQVPAKAPAPTAKPV